jgi:hypothetical protein
MIRRDLLLEEWVRLHAHEVLDIAEGSLNDAIVVCGAVELGTDDLVHEETSLCCVVCLHVTSVENQARRAETLYYHFPAHDAILNH